MPNFPPPLLQPYLVADSDSYSTLVTSTLAATSTWLLLQFVNYIFYGDSTSRTRKYESGVKEEGNPFHDEEIIILCSVLRPKSMWIEVGRKLGVDIQSMISTRRLYYIDALSGPLVDPSTRAIEYKGSASIVDKLKKDSHQIIDSLASEGVSRPKLTLIIDGIDFALSAEPAITAAGLSMDLLGLQERVHHLIVSVSADTPLLHHPRTPLEEKHQSFVTMIAHQSYRVLQLRSLDTGAARDISGVVRISQGGQYQADNSEGDLEEQEYLYFVSSGGNISVWSRGE